MWRSHCATTLIHRKRVTSELYDSYFRLMTIKHSISKIQWAIVWALNYYIIELSWVPKQLPGEFQTVETRCGKEGHTRPRGPSGTPMEWTPASGEQERHNVTVITVGSKYEVYVRSPAPSHMQTLEQPFRTLAIKWEVNICKEVFLRLPSCILIVTSCVLYSCVFIHASVFDVVSLWCWMMM